MLATVNERRSPVVQVIERPGGRSEVRGVDLGEVRGRCSMERVILECNCRARLVLNSRAAIRRMGPDIPECIVCGERFVLTFDGGPALLSDAPVEGA